jgi:hypothetical protein
MTIAFFHPNDADRRCTLRGLLRNLPPHLIHDIGLDPWPNRTRLPFHPLY